MSFLGGILPGFGDKKSSNQTNQTDARTVSDQSGAVVGSTINYNLYGDEAVRMVHQLNGGGRPTGAPFDSNAEAVGMIEPAPASPTDKLKDLAGNPMVLGGVAVVLLALAFFAGKR